MKGRKLVSMLVAFLMLLAILVVAALPTATVALAVGPNAIGGTWETKAPLAVEGAAASIIGDKLYVSHGYRENGDSNVLSIYDIPSNTWSEGPPATVSRSELIGVAADGRHYAIGGRPVHSTVEIYDPDTNMWSSGPPMPTARGGLGAATIDGKIYVVGGRTSSVPHSGVALATNEVLDTGTLTWASAAPMPVPMMDVYATVAFEHKIYVFGGYDGSMVRSTVQIYNPATNSWSSGAPIPTPRSNAVAGVSFGKIYVIGGFDGSTNLNVNEVYDPVTDTWATAPPKPTASSEMTAGDVSTGERIFLVGSGIFGLTMNIHEVFVPIPAPDITVSPSSLDFMWTLINTSSSPQTITVTNDGYANLSIGTVSISGTHASLFSLQSDNASNQTLVPGANAIVRVVFSPTTITHKSATLSIPSDDPDESLVNIALSGIGKVIPEGVGGEVAPINRAGVLAFWLGLVSMLALAIGAGSFARKRHQSHQV